MPARSPIFTSEKKLDTFAFRASLVPLNGTLIPAAERRPKSSASNQEN